MDWQSLLPPNSTDLERDIEEVFTKFLWAIPIDIDKIWRPDQCPSQLLPWLAWAFTVDAWDHEWLEAVKRRVIADSFLIHKRKGTRWSVERLLSIIGHNNIEIIEWWQTEPKGTPHTFYMQIPSSPGFDPVILSETQYQKIRRIVNEVKPVRSQYRFSVTSQFSTIEPPILAENGILDGTCPAESGITVPSFVCYRNAKTISVTEHTFSGGQVSAFSTIPMNLLKGNFFIKAKREHRWLKTFQTGGSAQPFFLRRQQISPSPQQSLNWQNSFQMVSTSSGLSVLNLGVVL